MKSASYERDHAGSPVHIVPPPHSLVVCPKCPNPPQNLFSNAPRGGEGKLDGDRSISSGRTGV